MSALASKGIANVLVTRRLTLRRPLAIDAESMAQALSNPKVSRNLAKVPHPYTVDDAIAWIKANTNNPCVYTIHRERLIGVVSIANGPDMPKLGYWLDEGAWGQGFMTEAARAAIAQAFRVFDADAIGSYAIADNDPSLNIMAKLGFEHTGSGTVFNHTRGEGYPTIKTTLDRSVFERNFGSLGVVQAA